jgi:hypothetical protein
MRRKDREEFFLKKWNNVFLKLPDNDQVIEIKVNKSFWNKCIHLNHAEVKSFLKRNGYLPWKKGNPPKFEMLQENNSCFKII